MGVAATPSPNFNAGTDATTVDRINFFAIDANPLIAGNQAFAFIANGVTAGDLNAGDSVL